MTKYIMSLDQGTTSSRCIIFDNYGNIISKSQKEFPQIYPQPGFIEHDPMDIFSSQLSVALEAMLKCGLTYENIDSIGITNQRETTICWDKNTGKPFYNAIVWQCRRTAPMIEKLKADGMEPTVKAITGLIPDAYFSATKIKWILDNVPEARKAANEGNLLFGTVDTWLIWNLTKGKSHLTDYTNASRTMLFDIHKLCWSKELLDYFGISESILPKVVPSSYDFGTASKTVLGGEIRICGVAGDQQSALFGQCAFEPGDFKNTYGTGCFLLMNTGKKAINSEHGLITTIAAGTDANVDYALEGSVFVGGASVTWLRDGLGLVNASAETEKLAASVPDTNGMYIVPAFTGLGAPYWNQYARGTAVGITRGCTKEHFVRATLESICYQVYDVIKAMEEDSGICLNELKVDGGASINDFLMQFQADILSAKVFRPGSVETTALGVAYLAGLYTGYFKDKNDLKNKMSSHKEFLPSMDESVRQDRIKGWERAIRCALFYGEEEAKDESLR